MTDFSRKRGDTYADEIIVTSTTTKLPINITGYTFKLTVDPKKDPVDSSLNLYQLNGTIIDAAAGRVEFAPTAIQADHIGTYYFDVQMIDTLGRIRTIDSGKYVYTQDITK